MKSAFLKLHVSILLAGFTGIFGKLITLNEGLLVWYRMLFTTFFMLMVLWIYKRLSRPDWRNFFQMAGVGSLLALHWVFFFGSIKASNISIGVICFSLTGFFTAFLEPLLNKRRIILNEILYSLITIAGILLIFHFDIRYRYGILLGIVSSLLAALFTITNKKLGKAYSSGNILLYEMTGGFLCLSFLLPFYLQYYSLETILPNRMDMVYLLLLSVFCTVLLYLLQINVLKSISAFTVNLSYNLEPVYSIILAVIFFGEAKELSIVFYIGLSLIILSVLLQTRKAFYKL